MKAKLLFMLLSFIGIIARSQVVTGVVVDKQSKQKLPGVNIYNLETKKGTVTANNGTFRLPLPRNGTYEIQFSYIGYQTEIKSISLQSDTFYMVVEMQPAVIEAQEVIVSAAYRSSQNEIPIPVKKVSSEDLTASGEANVVQALSQVPGVNSVNTGVSIAKPQIRGLSYNRVLVYAMGVPVDNQQWGDEHGLSITALGIDGVEVIKGPASLIYGADAMGGVLHFIDEKPAKINTVEGKLKQEYYTNTNGLQSLVNIKTARKNFRFGLGASFANHADYKQPNNVRVTNTRFHNTAIKGSAGFVLKHWISDWHYLYNQTALGIPEEISIQNIRKNLLPPNQLVTDQILSSSNTFIFKKHKIKLNAGILSNVRKEYEEQAFPVKSFRVTNDSSVLSMRLQTLNYDIKWYLPKIKNWEIIIGSQGKWQQNTNFNHQEYLIPDAKVWQAGWFGLFKYVKQALSFLGGLRYDIKNISSLPMGMVNAEGYMPGLSLQYANINGSAGVAWQLSTKTTLQVNVASGFRVPNLAELASNGIHEGTFRYEIGNPALNIEQNVEPDVIITHQGKHISFSANAFYNTIFNYIYLAPTDSQINSIKVYTYEQNSAYLYGGEATFDIHPHPYDWLHIELSYASVTGKTFSGDYLPRIPANSGSITLKANVKQWRKWQDLYISVSPRYYFPQRHIAFAETPTADYTLLNIMVGGMFKTVFRWFVSGQNILNARYTNHLSRLKYKGINGMGRNITFGVAYYFNAALKN